MAEIEKQTTNNHVTITGEIVSEFSYDHSVFGEEFYVANVKSIRKSGNNDIVPIMVSNRLLNFGNDCRGQFVTVDGQFRSYNRWYDNEKVRLVLFVFVKEIDFLDETKGTIEERNQIFLDGHVCKEPIYRRTISGREVADIFLKVGRHYGKSDYIPCICWGRNARYANSFKVGDRCTLSGRIQSRTYKKLVGETYEERTAYEVSCSAVDLVEERGEE